MRRNVDDIFRLLRQSQNDSLAINDDDLSDLMQKSIDRSVAFSGRKRKRRAAWLSAAASVAALIAAGITFWPEKEHQADSPVTKPVLTSVVHEKIVPEDTDTDDIKNDEAYQGSGIAVIQESSKTIPMATRVSAPQDSTEDGNIRQFIAQLNSTFDDGEDFLLAETMTSVASDISISCDVMGVMRDEFPLPELDLNETIGGLDNPFDTLEDGLCDALSSFPWETIFGDNNK